MTPQEIFDTAFTRVYAQGYQCGRTNSYGGITCQYTDGKGGRCAVGHLFNDKELGVFAHHGANIGQMIVDDHDTLGRPYLRPFFRQEEDLLSQIQEAHDYWTTSSGQTFLEYFAEKMRDVALFNRLSPAIIDKTLERAA